jgi:multidrug efflux pump subunit AcrB
VTDTIADRRTFARLKGEPVVAFGIKRSKGASDVVVAESVQKRVDELKVAYPDVTPRSSTPAVNGRGRSS